MSTKKNRPKKRTKGLQKLGVSEDDVVLAERLMRQIPACPSDPGKVERILGYATSRLEREKALRLLGTTEEEIEIENAKNMGSLGICGRRRSHSLIQNPSKPMYPKRKMSIKRHRHLSFDSAMKHRASKRKASIEIRRLRHQTLSSLNEIELLRRRIDELESLVQKSALSQGTSSSRTSSVIVEEKE